NANDARVSKNNVGKSQTNIFVIGNGADVSNNTVYDTDVFDGVALFGDNNKVQNNTIFNSDEAGVFVQGNSNKVKTNTINEAPIGILESAPSSGNDFNPNRFFNTGVNVVSASSFSAAPTNALQRASGRAQASPQPALKGRTFSLRRARRGRRAWLSAFFVMRSLINLRRALGLR
ncbi:MAG TPA: right-handed parallel beta-helix repeat-containing protein, partial [Pyrinomonadaceae bacterium]